MKQPVYENGLRWLIKELKKQEQIYGDMPIFIEDPAAPPEWPPKAVLVKGVPRTPENRRGGLKLILAPLEEKSPG